MNMNYFKFLIIFLLLPFLVNAETSELVSEPLGLLVYKTPTCGCCKKWISHLEEQGVFTHAKDFSDLGFVKNKFGIKPNYRSCHTAVSKDGFAFEGHVPAKFIKKFLKDKSKYPNAIGLSVPAMPVGSPGMEVGDRFMPYQVLLLLKDGTSEVYAKVNHYEEQF